MNEAIVSPPDEADERNTADRPKFLHREPAMNRHKTKRLGEMTGVLRGMLVIQIFLLLFTSLLLDGGVTFRFCLAGIAVHWMVVAYLALRRRNVLTLFDQIMIAAGFFIYIVIAGLMLTICNVVLNMLNL